MMKKESYTINMISIKNARKRERRRKSEQWRKRNSGVMKIDKENDEEE